MNVKSLRMLTGLSQSDFSSKFDIKVDTYRMWEQGVNPTPKYVLKMIETILKYEGYKVHSLTEVSNVE